MITKQIPNCITCLNLFSGILGVISAYNGDFGMAMVFVFASALFDFLDGLVARLLKAYSDIGKELDSLADMVSFGLLPGMVAFRLMEPLGEQWFAVAPYFGFLITVFSAIRLAKFNVDERQTSSFIGLAVPANAIFWVSVAYTFQVMLTQYAWSVPVLAVLSSFLLVSPLPMFSLKIKSLKWSDNRVRYIFLIGAIVLISLFRLDSLSFIIVWYILISILENIFDRK